MKIDPYKHKERYLAWKDKTTEAIPTYYFQGNLRQLTNFVKERFNK